MLQLSTPELQEAFLELNRIVSGPTERWDLRAVHRYVSDWIENGRTALERGEARLLVERIVQFESIRQRLAASMPAVSQAAAHLASDAASAVSSAVALSEQDSVSWDEANPSDASGWLTAVYTSRPGQPEFALTDASGSQVICYVQPAPGVNLRRYAGQSVALYGIKGYLPELNARQLTAERVVRVR